MIVRYSPRATRNLESIHQYLAKRSPKGALNVLAAIYATVEFIRRHPEAAQLTTFRDVRVKVVQRYGFKIFYRIAENDDHAVEIIHVRHSSRRPWLRKDD